MTVARTTAVALLALAAACAPDTPEPPMAHDTEPPSTEAAPCCEDALSSSLQDAPNTLTAQERADGWRLLFDGSSTDGWRGFKKDAPEGWSAVDGTLMRSGPGGDIITEERFEDFELSVDWRVEEGGNSGIFYLVTEDADRIFEAAPEMQVLDDEGHVDGSNPATSAGANYALHPVPRGVVNPAGEWNTARIVKRGDHVEHWLNGQRVVEYVLGSEDWAARVADSKFAQWPVYGQARSGHLGLQDHGDPVWFRNIKVRDLS